MSKINKRRVTTERINSEQLMEVLQKSECIVPKADVMNAYDALANKLNVTYIGLNPVVFVAMNGGLIPAGHLMTRMSFFHRMEYLHATRYKDNVATDTLQWLSRPTSPIKGENILIIDDIFDEGMTLKAIVNELSKEKPKSIKTCVLLNKEHNRKVKGFKVDFIGLNIPDRFVFGCGMDYHGYLRHLAGIFAI